MNRRIFVLERKLPQLTVELFTRHLTHQERKFIIQNRVRMTTVILPSRFFALVFRGFSHFLCAASRGSSRAFTRVFSADFPCALACVFCVFPHSFSRAFRTFFARIFALFFTLFSSAFAMKIIPYDRVMRNNSNEIFYFSFYFFYSLFFFSGHFCAFRAQRLA